MFKWLFSLAEQVPSFDHYLKSNNLSGGGIGTVSLGKLLYSKNNVCISMNLYIKFKSLVFLYIFIKQKRCFKIFKDQKTHLYGAVSHILWSNLIKSINALIFLKILVYYKKIIVIYGTNIWIFKCTLICEVYFSVFKSFCDPFLEIPVLIIFCVVLTSRMI